MKTLSILIFCIFVVSVVSASDISHTPLVDSLSASDRFPLGRPSDGHTDGNGKPYTGSVGLIKSYLESQPLTLQSGTVATTQEAWDNSNNIATNSYVDRAVSIFSNEISDATYSTLSDAITAATGKNLIITKQWTLATRTITGPATLTIKPGGRLVVTSGQVVTINTPFVAGIYQVFSADIGGIVFGPSTANEIYPEWWGIDGTADDVQINCALQSKVDGPIIVLQAKVYYIASTITRGSLLEKPYSIIGKGAGTYSVLSGSRLYWTGGPDTSVIKLFNFSVLKGVGIANGNISANLIGVDFSGSQSAPVLWRQFCILEDVMVYSCFIGFKIDYSGRLTASSVSAFYCSYGFSLGTEANAITFNNARAVACYTGVTDNHGTGSRTVVFNGLDLELNTAYGIDMTAANSRGWVINGLYTEANSGASARLGNYVTINGAFFNEWNIETPLIIYRSSDIRLFNIFCRSDIVQLLTLPNADSNYGAGSITINSGTIAGKVANSIVANPRLITNGILTASSYTKIETGWIDASSALDTPISTIGENFNLSTGNKYLVAMYVINSTPLVFTGTINVGAGLSAGYIDLATVAFSSSPLAIGVHSVPLVSGAATIWQSNVYSYFAHNDAATSGKIKFVLFLI